MPADLLFVLGLLAVSMLLFATEWIPAELVAVGALVALALSGVLSVEQALAGFSSEAVIAIASLLVMGRGLVRSGVVRWMADRLGALAAGSQRGLLLLGTGAPALLSGFINVVAAVTVFIPAVRRMALSAEVPASRLLMPMAFGGLLGANLTLIGASHNLVVDSLLRRAGLPGLGFFELTPAGAVLVAVAVLYAYAFARRLLPGDRPEPSPRAGRDGDALIRTYGLQDRLWQVWVGRDEEGGPRLSSVGTGQHYGLTVIALIRNETQHPVETHAFALQEGDVLLMAGRHERVEALCAAFTELTLLGSPQSGDPFPVSDADLAEVVVPPRSDAVGATLRDLDLRRRTGLSAVALWRDGAPLRTDVGSQALRPGDALLLYGARTRIRDYRPEPQLLWLSRPPEEEAPRRLRHLAAPSGLVFLAVIASAALGWTSIAVATLAGAAAMVLMGLMPPRRAYAAIDGRTIVLIAAMLPMGTALSETGAARVLANMLVTALGELGPLAVLMGVSVLTMTLTQPLHNAAVAVVMTPVALDAAGLIQADPRPFAMAVIISASASFLMPVGHPAPLLVQRPGGYRPGDFVRFGLGLNLLCLAVIAALVPVLWPLAR